MKAAPSSMAVRVSPSLPSRSESHARPGQPPDRRGSAPEVLPPRRACGGCSSRTRHGRRAPRRSVRPCCRPRRTRPIRSGSKHHDVGNPCRPVAPAIRRDRDVPLHLRAADARHGVDAGHHGDGLRDDREDDLPGHDQVLGQALRHQLRPRRHDRPHDGVPVRDQLVVLLALRRRHLRRAARHRGPDGVLPRVDVHRPLLLRLGPPVAGAGTSWSPC